MMLPVMSGLAATEYIMAHLPDADPDRLGVDQPRRAVQDLRGARGRRGRRARKADGRRARTATGSGASSHGEAGVAHQGHHPPARAAARPRPLPPARGLRRQPGTAPRRPARASSRSAPRPAGRARWSRSCARCPRTSRCRSCSSLHINEPFGTAFAEWLDGQTGAPRRLRARRRAAVAAAGRVVMAPPGQHLVVARRALAPDARPRAPLLPPVGRRALRVGGARIRAARGGGCCSPAWGATARPACSRSARPAGSPSRRTRRRRSSTACRARRRMLGAAEQVLPLGEIGPLARRVWRQIEARGSQHERQRCSSSTTA